MLTFSVLRFTNVIGDKRYSTEDADEPSRRKSARLSSPPPPTESRTVYPNVCQLCEKYKMQHKNKTHYPHKILTYNTADAIKASAKNKDKRLYCDIAFVDIVAKEFHVHDPCYKSFTLEYYRGINESSKACSSRTTAQQQETQPSYSKSNYEEVKQYVNDSIIKEKKPASIKLLHDIYGIGIGCTSYRQKLKERLKSDFGDKISFLSQENKTLPEIVISNEYFTADKVLYSEEQTVKYAAKILRNNILTKFKSFSNEQ